MQRWTKQSTQLILILILSLLFIQPAQAQTEEELPIVHAVLFYSPTCPHCHTVIDDDLPPLIEQYGEQLLIVCVNTQSVEGQELYLATVEYFELPPERQGVPALVVGETMLVGSGEIPTLFPGIIEKGLEEGGIPWPPIPGFIEAFTASAAQATAQADEADQATQPTAEPTENESPQPTQPTQAPDPTSTPEAIAHADDADQAEEPDPTSMAMALPDADSLSLENESMIDKFRRDPVGNTASVVVLIGMVLSLVGIWLRLKRPIDSTKDWGRLAIPVLVAVGFVVAGYLSYVEVTQSKAVCGPVGDCNTVQQSPYAKLFGVLPVGVLGLAGYVAILTAWVAQYYGAKRWRKLAAQALWGFALFGTLFSIYLTFLEPFVIGATCAWCLTSAIVITLILWIATDPLQYKKKN